MKVNNLCFVIVNKCCHRGSTQHVLAHCWMPSMKQQATRGSLTDAVTNTAARQHVRSLPEAIAETAGNMCTHCRRQHVRSLPDSVTETANNTWAHCRMPSLRQQATRTCAHCRMPPCQQATRALIAGCRPDSMHHLRSLPDAVLHLATRALIAGCDEVGNIRRAVYRRAKKIMYYKAFLKYHNTFKIENVIQKKNTLPCDP